MKIVVDRRAKRIKCGRKHHYLHEVKEERYDFLAEPSKITFGDFSDIVGSDLPDRVQIETYEPKSRYTYADFVRVVRCGDRVQIGVSCGYFFDRWTEPVSMMKFYERLVRLLKRNRQFTVDSEVDFQQNQTNLEVSADFPLSRRLSSGYDEIINLLLSMHAKAMDALLPKLLRTALVRGRKSGRVTRRPRQGLDCFVCHDSRDKRRAARPIVAGLSALGCSVWYDEHSMHVGAPLRESIERGLREAKKCILILSQHSLSNTGWTKTEFDSVFIRELIEKRNLLLPVWIDVSNEQVFAYSPSLANRLAVNWKEGLHKVVQRLYEATRARTSRRYTQ